MTDRAEHSETAPGRRASAPDPVRLLLVAGTSRVRRMAEASLARGDVEVTRVACGVDQALGTPLNATVAAVEVRDLSTAGAEEVRVLGAHLPDLPVLVIAETTSGQALRRALEAGASGLIATDDIAALLVAAVAAVQAGLTCFPRTLPGRAVRPVLTVREKQILGMIVLGMSNASIAARLHLAETTIKSHLTVAYGKLGVRSRNEAAAAILDPNDGFGAGILRISPAGTGADRPDDR